MTRWRCWLMLLMAMASSTTAQLAQTSQPPLSNVTDDQVVAVIDKAKTYLYGQQKDGNWELSNQRVGTRGDNVTHDQWGGLTAIATCALLAAGESPQDPRLQSAIEFLRNAEIIGIYATGMRAQVWTYLPASESNRAAIRKDAEILIRGLKDLPEGGFWDYVTQSPTKRADHSVSQYGVLGLWACSDAGLQIPRETWEKIERGWLRTQHAEGGWGYLARRTEMPTTTMTAAGIATLFITQDQLHVSDGLNCNGNVSNPAIDRAIDWIIAHYDQVTALRQKYVYYGLYGIERIGVASGHKYLGPINWYQHGARYLLQTQAEEGSWNARWGRGSDIADTAFGLLFLARGRSPLVFNKLQYRIHADDQANAEPSTEPTAPEGNWNQRSRDAAGLSRWIGKQTERDLHWQIVNLDAPVDELHDAPILYVAGNQSLRFSPQERVKIKSYVESGGMILGNADCGEMSFAESFKKLGHELFPAYRFRELPESHVIYRNQQFQRSRWQNKPSVQALSNGVREMMILIPTADAGRAWQIQSSATKPELYELGANVFLYAVEKQNLRFKGQTYVVTRDETIQPTATIRVARLKYDGNWDPEPGGWRRLTSVMHNRLKIRLAGQVVDLSTGSLDGFDVAHLTGTGSIQFDSDARKQLQDFARGGGTIVVDAAGGAEAFAKSVEAELRLTFPDHPSFFEEPLPPEHPAYAAATDVSASDVAYRAYTRVNRVGKAKTPRIRAMQVNNRAAIFFSAEDLGAGLVGQPVDGLFGYEPQSATDLMIKLLIYAASATPTASSPASTRSK